MEQVERQLIDCQTIDVSDALLLCEALEDSGPRRRAVIEAVLRAHLGVVIQHLESERRGMTVEQIRSYVYALGLLGAQAWPSVPALLEIEDYAYAEGHKALADDVQLALERIGPPSRQDLNLLLSLLQHPSSRVRRHVLDLLALVDLSKPDVRPICDAATGQLILADSPAVVVSACDLLRKCAIAIGDLPQGAQDALLSTLSEASDPLVVEAAILAQAEWPSVCAELDLSLRRALPHYDRRVRRAAFVSLHRHGAAVVELCVEMLKSGSPDGRAEALSRLRGEGPLPSSVAEMVRDRLSDDALQVRLEAVKTVEGLWGTSPYEHAVIVQGLRSPDPSDRLLTLVKVREMGVRADVVAAEVGRLVSDGDKRVRSLAQDVLAFWRAEEGGR